MPLSLRFLSYLQQLQNIHIKKISFSFSLSLSLSLSLSDYRMLSMAVQPSFRTIETTAFNHSSLNKTSFSKLPISKNQIFAIPINPFCLNSQTHIRSQKKFNLSVSSAVAEIEEEEEATAEDSQPQIEKLGVVVKPISKPRLVLKFIWMEKNIGLGLDQVIPGHGSIPLSPYYFWPRKDAWEELKLLLETKPWISQKQMIILLNQATDIINLWQQSGGDLS